VRSRASVRVDPSGMLSIPAPRAECSPEGPIWGPTRPAFRQGANRCASGRVKDARELVNTVLSQGQCKAWMDANGCGGNQQAHLDCCSCGLVHEGFCYVAGGGGYNLKGTNTITLCDRIIEEATIEEIASILIHEAVHTCGWWRGETVAEQGQQACMSQIVNRK
jgi:hypothetical protein